MSNYYTMFSWSVPLQSKAQVKFFEDEAAAAAERYEDVDYDGPTVCSITVFKDANETDRLASLFDEGGSGGVDYAADVVQRFMKKFKIKGERTFSWANTCDKPHADSQGGGALTISADGRWSEEEQAAKYRKIKKTLLSFGDPETYLKAGLVTQLRALRSML